MLDALSVIYPYYWNVDYSFIAYTRGKHSTGHENILIYLFFKDFIPLGIDNHLQDWDFKLLNVFFLYNSILLKDFKLKERPEYLWNKIV